MKRSGNQENRSKVASRCRAGGDSTRGGLNSPRTSESGIASRSQLCRANLTMCTAVDSDFNDEYYMPSECRSVASVI